MTDNSKEIETLVAIITILKELPQPDREYILELLKHWERIR
jgi:hypothetical protein